MKRARAMAFRVPQLVTAGLALAAGTLAACAQDTAPYTLHAYTNLIQVPALVLGEDLKPISSVKREQFAISLDHGPAFEPTQMRMEGDDPISLAVLLDARGDQDDILRLFGQALAGLVPNYLHPADHVSIYAIDCALNQTADQLPADAAALEAGVARALNSPGLHGAQQHGACGNSIRLWDAVAKVAEALGAHPGRRVLLIVSKGMDGRSSSGFAETVHTAESSSVAIFGLRNLETTDTTTIKFSGNTLTYHNGPPPNRTVTVSTGADPAFLDQMCESTGGLAFNLWNAQLLHQGTPEVAPHLENMVTLLRSRYILEFPRPDAYAPGQHYVAVSVPQTHTLVLTTGVAYLSADPARLADPTTVRSNPSPAELGPRRPLEPKP
jgi:VWFA-related protein